MPVMTTEPEYTLAEAATYLALTPGTVRQYLNRSLLHPTRRIGRLMLFAQSELDRYQRERRPRGTPGHRTAAE